MLIGISGGSGSGKTTLAQRLIRTFGEYDVCLIQQDSYYKDQSHHSFPQREKINYDVPDVFDFSLLIQHLQDLNDGTIIAKPVYNFEAHTRAPETERVSPKAVTILEGILIFHEKAVRDLCDLKIFLDIAEDLRFERRLQRDVVERGRSRESVVRQWTQSVQPMYERYIFKTSKYADVVYGKDPGPEDIARLTALIEKRR
jgi:uridine kinase